MISINLVNRYKDITPRLLQYFKLVYLVYEMAYFCVSISLLDDLTLSV